LSRLSEIHAHTDMALHSASAGTSKRLQAAENLSCICGVQSNPVVSAPTKHAANGAQREHSQQAVESARFRRLEPYGFAPGTHPPNPKRMRQPSGQCRPGLLMCLSLPDLSPRSLKCATLCLTSIRVQPGKKTADAPGGQSDAGIGRSVIQLDGVSIRSDGLPAREHNIVHIAVPFIRSLRPEDP